MMVPDGFARRIFVHLAYLDDSGTGDKGCQYQVVCAVLIEDRHFSNLEVLQGVAIERSLPEERWDQFEEFHAREIYRGHGIWHGIDEAKRFEAIELILRNVDHLRLPVIYTAVDKGWLVNNSYPSQDPVDVAFREVLDGIQSWLTHNAQNDLCLLIFDDTSNKILRKRITKSFRELRRQIRPPTWNAGCMWNIHDDMYFGSSKESIGIQMADLCGYFVNRHLVGRRDSESFYDIFSNQIICSEVKPES